MNTKLIAQNNSPEEAIAVEEVKNKCQCFDLATLADREEESKYLN